MSSAGATAKLPVMQATEAYEAWLRKRLDVVEADLQYKHQQMKASLFAVLRGTFYRWAALWDETCPDLAKAPRLLAVGDLHVQNFGTWRDLEGRLVWGINDLVEVATMPYAINLVRTVASAIIAKRENGLTIDEDAMAAAMLEGYSQSLAISPSGSRIGCWHRPKPCARRPSETGRTSARDTKAPSGQAAVYFGASASISSTWSQLMRWSNQASRYFGRSLR